jgi:hypothetical protein
MLKKFRKSLAITVTAVALLVVPLVTPAAVFASSPDVAKCLKSGATLSTNCETENAVANGANLQDMVTRLVNLFSLVVAIVAVVMIIFGGFRYITSGGDSGNVSGAKNTIIYAIVGLVVVALAQLIVRFVTENVTAA